MTYDNELTLISEILQEDEIGNQIATEIKTNIFCNFKSIGRTEFYNAASNRLKPSLIFIIHAYEYNGEKYVEFSEDLSPKEKYKVIKTYKIGIEELELTCEKVLGNG